MHDDLAYFLDLRLRLRGRPAAIAIVDRCLSIIARAETAGPDEIATLEREVDGLRDELVARFGRKAPLKVH